MANFIKKLRNELTHAQFSMYTHTYVLVVAANCAMKIQIAR